MGRVLSPVLVGRLSVFLRGGGNHFARITGVLNRTNMGVSTFAITRGSSFNVLHLVISSASATVGILHSHLCTIDITSIIYLRYPGRPKTLTGTVSVVASTKVFVRCVCTFSRNRTTGIVVHPSGIRGYTRILGTGGLRLVTTDSLCGLWVLALDTSFVY